MVGWMHALRAIYWKDFVPGKDEQSNAPIYDGTERKVSSQDFKERTVHGRTF
jgi:hypothetical protein